MAQYARPIDGLTRMARVVSVLLLSLSGRSDQNPGSQNDGATQNNLEYRLQERCIHITGANPCNYPQFNKHDYTCNASCDPESIGHGTWHQIWQSMAKTAKCRHQAADQAANQRRA